MELQRHLVIITHSLANGPVQFFSGLTFALALQNMGVETAMFLSRSGAASVSLKEDPGEANEVVSNTALQHITDFVGAGGQCFICSTCFEEVFSEVCGTGVVDPVFAAKVTKIGFAEMIEYSLNCKVVTF